MMPLQNASLAIAVVLVSGSCMPCSMQPAGPVWNRDSITLVLKVAFGKTIELSPDWCGVVYHGDSAEATVGICLRFNEESLEDVVVDELTVGTMDYVGSPATLLPIYVEHAESKFSMGGIICGNWWPPRIGHDGVIIGDPGFNAFVVRECAGNESFLSVYVYRAGGVRGFDKALVSLMEASQEASVYPGSLIPSQGGSYYARYGSVDLDQNKPHQSGGQHER